MIVGASLKLFLRCRISQRTINKHTVQFLINKVTNMKRYKIVCSDLDGTLLNNNSEISKENLKAIDELVEHGVYFVPSTGRAYGEIPEELRDNSAIRFMICSNGAVLLDRQEKKVTLPA